MDPQMERVIRELCAFLPNTNGRQTWGDYGVRDYLSVDGWIVCEISIDLDGDGFTDFWVEHTKPGLPGKFQIRIEASTGRVLGVWNAMQTSEDPMLREQHALLFDLTYTPFMADRLTRHKPIDHPDAGSW